MNGGQRDGYFKAAWRKLAHLRAACQTTLARSAEPAPENVPSPKLP